MRNKLLSLTIDSICLSAQIVSVTLKINQQKVIVVQKLIVEMNLKKMMNLYMRRMEDVWTMA